MKLPNGFCSQLDQRRCCGAGEVGAVVVVRLFAALVPFYNCGANQGRGTPSLVPIRALRPFDGKCKTYQN